MIKMDKKDYELSKSKFLSLYPNVPLPLRKEIIAVVDKEPISWNAAYIEIKADSKSSGSIIEHLKMIGLL
jgi:hypothetical protein